MRSCLRCDKDFLSEGPWNRICGPCKTKNKVQMQAHPLTGRLRDVNGQELDEDELKL